MWMQGLQAVLIGLTSYKQWNAGQGTIGTSLTSESLLTWFAVVALAISVILLFWVYAKRARTETKLRENITDLTVTTFKLRQEKDELAAANKKLQQAVSELSGRQAAVLENMKKQLSARK
ncbi:MAG: hypothetical protein AMJ65_08990 [Phycisphaerae bacterium SG8_4]|nr:MAG: hypothetical protein AMJ65_08990 [Phycisphaerae bacterium SG8_4]